LSIIYVVSPGNRELNMIITHYNLPVNLTTNNTISNPIIVPWIFRYPANNSGIYLLLKDALDSFLILIIQ